MIAGLTYTHADLRCLLKNPGLSATAQQFMDDEAARGHDFVVSSISLAEIVYLVEKNRLPVSAYYSLKTALVDPDYVITEAPFHIQIVEAMRPVPRFEVSGHARPHRCGSGCPFRRPMISRDGRIRASNLKTV